MNIYTNIPIIQAIESVISILNKYRNTSQMPANKSICELLELVLRCNNFQFNGENYVQIGGTAMGTKVAPSLANILMADFEEKFVSNYHLKLLLYKRFIDNTVMIWPHSRELLNEFISHLNQCHESITFTAEI